jgi:hypothetical protein
MNGTTPPGGVPAFGRQPWHEPTQAESALDPGRPAWEAPAPEGGVAGSGARLEVPPGFRPRSDFQGYAGDQAAPLAEPSSEAAEESGEASIEALPQRVPAEPDVPTVPEPPSVEPPAEAPELTRIASHLRRFDVSPQPQERPEGFDVAAVLAAVRGVGGVRDASLRTSPGGAHTLRLDLADGADPAQVSREVARLLQERMGLAAAPQHTPPASAARIVPRQATYGTPIQPVPPPAALPGAHAAPAPGVPFASAPRRRHPVAAVREPAPGTEGAPVRSPRSGAGSGLRVVIDHIQVSTYGHDATVEVRLAAGAERAVGRASGPAVDGYLLRLCAASATAAIDHLLNAAPAGAGRRCLVEHVAVVPFGSCEVAVTVVLLVFNGLVEQLTGSALVAGDPRQAVVRATLAAVNRRLEALLS